MRHELLEDLDAADLREEHVGWDLLVLVRVPERQAALFLIGRAAALLLLRLRKPPLPPPVVALPSWLRLVLLLVRVVVDPTEPGASLADSAYHDEIIAVNRRIFDPEFEVLFFCAASRQIKRAQRIVASHDKRIE